MERVRGIGLLRRLSLALTSIIPPVDCSYRMIRCYVVSLYCRVLMQSSVRRRSHTSPAFYRETVERWTLLDHSHEGQSGRCMPLGSMPSMF
jgi:hypothetical protein